MERSPNSLGRRSTFPNGAVTSKVARLQRALSIYGRRDVNGSNCGGRIRHERFRAKVRSRTCVSPRLELFGRLGRDRA
jgi:hypothetical protein